MVKLSVDKGVFYAPFMFDINTPNVANPVINGNKLVGETLLLRLENNDNTQVILYAINIYGGYVSIQFLNTYQLKFNSRSVSLLINF